MVFDIYQDPQQDCHKEFKGGLFLTIMLRARSVPQISGRNDPGHFGQKVTRFHRCCFAHFMHLKSTLFKIRDYHALSL